MEFAWRQPLPDIMTAPLRRNGALVSHIQRSCEKKRRYPDQITASAVGMGQQEQTGRTLWVYRCRFCKGWHLTKRDHGYSLRVDRFFTKADDRVPDIDVE